ncbi:MAG: MBL fold metallo-hydrolase [Clostridiales bacterium]|nr:MBL fold metallo-hydrolase [Clostridiales bacterium]
MEISVHVVGILSTNCYLLKDPDTASCWIIDPGGNTEDLIHLIQEQQLTLKKILITHGHMDHFQSAARLKEQFDCPIVFHPEEVAYLNSERLQRSLYAPNVFRHFKEALSDAVWVRDGERLTDGALDLQVIEVPGHTAHSICFFDAADKVVFCGDTLFADSIGRTDLYEGDPRELIGSIKNKLMVLPDDTIVAPGHGPLSTIGDERKHNYYVGENA